MWWPLVLMLLACALVVLFVFRRYGTFRGTPWYVVTAVLGGWFLSFAVVVLIPVDISSSFYESCLISVDNSSSLHDSSLEGNPSEQCHKPMTFIGLHARETLWRVTYWTTYFAIWLVYPILQSYVGAPHFKRKHRLWAAIRDNLLFYAVAGVLGLFFLLLIGVSGGLQGGSDVMGIAIALANTWGLCMLIALLGVGFVVVPRTLWRRAKRHVTLREYQWKVAELHTQFEDARRELHTNLKLLKALDQNTRSTDPYRKYVDCILDHAPPEYETILHGEGNIEPRYEPLVQLNKKVIQSAADLTRSKVLYEQLLQKAFALEDVINFCEHPRGRPVIHWSFRRPWSNRFAGIVSRLEALWYRHLEKIVCRTLAILCGVLSICIIWTEATFFVFLSTKGKVDLSILSQLMPRDSRSYALINFIALMTVCYIALCSYSTVFLLKVWKFFRFLPHGLTDSVTLLFSAALLGRLAPPMAYNYLLMIHVCDGDRCSHSSAYSRVMKDMEVVSFFGKSFNYYFPILLMLLAVGTLFHWHNKILACCRIKRFQFEDDFEHEQIDEGAEILRLEREKLEQSGFSGSMGRLDDLDGGDSDAVLLVSAVDEADAEPRPGVVRPTPAMDIEDEIPDAWNTWSRSRDARGTGLPLGGGSSPLHDTRRVTSPSRRSGGSRDLEEARGPDSSELLPKPKFKRPFQLGDEINDF